MKKAITRLVLFLAISFSSFAAFSQSNYIDFGYSIDSYCEPSQLTLFDFSSIYVSQGPLEYKWYIDNIFVSSDQYPAAIPIAKGYHTFTLEIYDTLSLLGYQYNSVETYGKITDFIISPGSPICPGQSVHLSINTSTYSLTWTSGAVSYFTPSTSNNFETDFTYDKPGVYDITLIANSFCGIDTVIKSLTVGNSAIPSLNPADIYTQPGCINDPITFNVSNNYASYFWEFGDGATSNLPQPQHVYNTKVPVDYTAKLTVTNECGGSAFANFLVQIQDGLVPDANFDYQSLIGWDKCPGTPVKFSPYGAGSYYWDFGDGTISNDKNPVHQFSQSNLYPVTLTVTNGCLNSSSTTNYVSIYSGESWIPEPFFSFDANSEGPTGQRDTLYICPGQTVGFINHSYGDQTVSYTWDFGSGYPVYGYNASHLFSDPGLFSVSLTASNLCGASQTSVKYVKVDNGTLPAVALNSIPASVCVGDKVYFFDDNFDLKNNYTYSIDFDDGSFANNIKDNSDSNIRTLADHSYSNIGNYSYVFTATNFCGNSVSSTGTIMVDNDATRKPFYYIENSTEDKSNIDPVDWSARHDPSDYEIDIPVNWPTWKPAYGNDFFILLYYGFIGTEGQNGKPNGYVHFNTSSIVSGISVKAYIPISVLDPPTLGILAAYSCTGFANNDDPADAVGILRQDGTFMPSIPIIPSGYSDLAASGMVISIDSTWNGVCASTKIEGTWYKLIEPGVYAQITLYDDGYGGLSYEMKYTDAIVDYSKSNSFEMGEYTKSINNDTISFYNWYGCNSYGDYGIFKPNAVTIEFTTIDEGCPDRLPFISGTFTKVPEFNLVNQLAVCPGDKVQFKVVGGETYQWIFGDGNTSTLQYPVHAYAAPAVYDAKVITTNSCGRQDTLHTKVTVMAKPADNVFFWVPENERIAGDSIHFYFEDWYNYGLDNNTYLWDFGDGNTSSLKNPVHLYNNEGDYNISLTVTDGCGSATRNENLTISPKFRFCDAQFDFSWDGNPGYFYDQSLGDPTAWSWDFGDGTYSTEKNPVHDFPADGVYTVTLTIFNPQTNCIASITKQVVATWDLVCQAEFTSVVNSVNGVASFTSLSTNATDYYWDFGDGDYSIEENPIHTYANSGFYSACLYIWNSTNNCQSYVCKDIMVIPADSAYIQADFSFYNDPADNTLYLYDLSTPNTTNWYWTMGDGMMLETQNPVYTYSKPGVYDVCLISYDNTNYLSSYVCKKVRIGDVGCAVSSEFSYFINPETFEVGFNCLASGSVDEYYWTFGDGSSSTLENPGYQYATPGYYEVTLVVRISSDNCMDKLTKYIQVGNVDCRAGFTYRVNPLDNSVDFEDDSKGIIDYYYWDFGDGTSSVESNPTQFYNSAGNYWVGQFVIDNFNNCVDYIVQAVQVGQVDCSADFMSYIDSANYTAYFTNRNLGESTALLWSFGDGGFSTEENPVHQFPGVGLYSAGLNTYNYNNGCMDYYEEYLLIGGLGKDCQADFVYRVDPVNGEVTFSNQSIGDIVDFVWSFGDETDAIVPDPIHEYSVGGYYNVCLSVTNSDGIRNTACKWIYIEGNPVSNCRANFMFTTDSSSLTAKFVDYSYGDIDTYTWNFGDHSADSASSDPNPDHIYSQKGYYLVQLMVENSATGCVSSEFKLLNIAEDQVLKAAFAYEAQLPDKKFAGYPVDLVSASSGDGATVEWDFGDKQLKKGNGKFIVMDSTSRRVTHYYELPGKYEVCVRISDPVRDISDIYCSWVYTKNAVNVDETSGTGINLNVYPNPFVDYTSINYSLQESDFIELAIFDQLGRKIETLVKSRQDTGNYQITWETKTVTAGVYHLKMITAEGISTKQLVITK